MMDAKKLTRKTFREQMLGHGYLSEQVPQCFSSVSLAQHADEIMPLIGKNFPTLPTVFSTFKNDLERRIVAVPNPYSYVNTVKLLDEHWRLTKKLASSENSLSPILYMRRYNSGVAEAINCERVRERYKSKSTFSRNARECITAALGCRYQLKVDITSCYDSMSTQSLLWASCGCDAEKRRIGGKIPARMHERYEFASHMCSSMANQNGHKMHCIITGPYTSRIFSEMVLAGIDSELRKALSGLPAVTFRRFVDDYKFYLRTKSDATEASYAINSVLKNYGLKLNPSKMSINVYPFDLLPPIARRLNAAYDEAGITGMLNEAGILHEEGSPGAYKYALKAASTKELLPGEEKAALSMLVNIYLSAPKWSKHVSRIIAANRDRFETCKLSGIISAELLQCIQLGYEQEVADFLCLAKLTDIPLPAECIFKTLESGNDIAILIALDLWRNHRDSIKSKSHETRRINVAISNLENMLKGETLDESHWLLMYEAHRLGFLESATLENGRSAPFMQELLRMGVSFYQA